MDSKFTIFWVLVPLLLAGALYIAGTNTPDIVTKDQLQQLGYYKLQEKRRLDFQLINQHGEPVDASSLLGRTTLVFFGFTHCPDVCPTTLSVLNMAIEGSATAPDILLVTVDPEQDTPEVIGNYVAAFNREFKAYTGSKEQILAFANQLDTRFQKVEDPENGTWTVDHSANLMVINEQGEYQGLIRPPFDPGNIATVLALLERQ